MAFRAAAEASRAAAEAAAAAEVSAAEALTIEDFEVKRFPRHYRLILLILAVALAGACLACTRKADAIQSLTLIVPSEGEASPSDALKSDAVLAPETEETADLGLRPSTSAVQEITVPDATERTEEITVPTSQSTQGTTVQTTIQADAPPTTMEEPSSTAKTAAMTAFLSVDVSEWSEQEIRDCFYAQEISDDVFARMDGKSFKADCTTKRSDLRYIRILHVGFDGQTRVGELVANKKIAQDFVDIFYELYLNRYPLEKVVLVDEYGADDNLSMADNNTSSFNFRRVVGTSNLSRHALGMAIDVNPLYNPWVYELDGEAIVDPPGGAPYVDRSVDCPYIIDHDDLFYQLLIQHGFTWGGDWATEMDYQHFSKAP
ncbi:MAG: M15 family metallopeptidase [Bacteroidales bacterium]